MTASGGQALMMTRLKLGLSQPSRAVPLSTPLARRLSPPSPQPTPRRATHAGARVMRAFEPADVIVPSTRRPSPHRPARPELSQEVSNLLIRLNIRDEVV